jgi:hypothetical protein
MDGRRPAQPSSAGRVEDDDSDFSMIDDEALWSAACRAHESTRADRLLDDPYAARLAGTRGERLFGTTRGRGRAFAAALRTASIDDLLLRTIFNQHLHAVVALGTELDTRPYRLALPNDLRWVDLESDSLITYQDLRLAHAAPACRVARVGVDVLNTEDRQTALERSMRGVARAVLLLEDVRALRPGEPAALAQSLPAGIRWWLQYTASTSGLVEQVTPHGWQAVKVLPLDIVAARLAPDRLRELEADKHAGLDDLDLGTVWLLHRSTAGSST